MKAAKGLYLSQEPGRPENNRTRSAMEIDFIPETHQGIPALEVKNHELVSAKDFTISKTLKDATFFAVFRILE